LPEHVGADLPCNFLNKPLARGLCDGNCARKSIINNAPLPITLKRALKIKNALITAPFWLADEINFPKLASPSGSAFYSALGKERV